MPDTRVRGESKSVQPSDPFKALSDRFDRLFGDFHFPGFGRGILSQPHFANLTSSFDFREPKVNVAETDKAYEITAELPGLDEKSVEVNVADGVLTFRGEKREEKEEKDEKKNYHLVERSYGSFQRSFALPDNVEEDKIAADFEKGVLRINIPKTKPSAPKAETRKIAIKTK